MTWRAGPSSAWLVGTTDGVCVVGCSERRLLLRWVGGHYHDTSHLHRLQLVFQYESLSVIRPSVDQLPGGSPWNDRYATCGMAEEDTGS